MTDETDAPQGGAEAEAIAETSTVETTSEATAEQQTEAENTGQADDTGEEAPAKKVPWFQKRIDEVTAKKYEAEREAAYWRGVAEATHQPKPQAQPEAVPDRWEDPEGYDKWLITQAKQAARDEFKRETLTTTYEGRVTKLRESKPDYDSVVNNPSLPITPMMADVIRESDVGPEVAYHLGTNPQEAARIASLPHHRQAAELGKLEVRLSQPAPKAPTPPPPPPPPATVAGIAAGLNKTPEEMSMSEFIKWREGQS